MKVFKSGRSKETNAGILTEVVGNNWATEEPAQGRTSTVHNQNIQNKWWEQGSSSFRVQSVSDENSGCGNTSDKWWEQGSDPDGSVPGDGSKPNRRASSSSKGNQPRRQSLADKLDEPVDLREVMKNQKRQREREQEYKRKQDARQLRIDRVKRQWEESRGIEHDEPEEEPRFSCCSSILLCAW